MIDRKVVRRSMVRTVQGRLDRGEDAATVLASMDMSAERFAAFAAQFPDERLDEPLESDPLPAAPPFTAGGAMPHYAGAGPYPGEGFMPLVLDVEQVRARFCTNEARRTVFHGFETLRGLLQERGVHGYQWLGGSFITDKEQPGDIDVITFFDAGGATVPMVHEMIFLSPLPMSSREVKEQLRCDAYFVEARRFPLHAIRAAAIWCTQFLVGGDPKVPRGIIQIAL